MIEIPVKKLDETHETQSLCPHLLLIFPFFPLSQAFPAPLAL